ncbi:phosphomannomutase [Alphaproteobacteria bacterium LSUCC0684]
MKVLISDLADKANIKFGTSGLRGLVTDLSDEVCFAYTQAFLQSTPIKHKRVVIGHDLRPSSPRITQACITAAEQLGFTCEYVGALPTPALAHFGIQNNIPGIMVTGSHIPFDRNGIKFYRLDGEISKDDEQSIMDSTVSLPDSIERLELPEINSAASELYLTRYTSLFAPDFLKGKTIAIYEHSGVARDLLSTLFKALGAEVISLGRSDTFVPIDTEAVRQEDIQQAKAWAAEHHFDMLVSTDGDADRPLIADEHGEFLRGDIVGILCAQYLKASHVATPVSSNTAVEKSGLFKSITRTKIGSPYVIEAMDILKNEHLGEVIAGYEANGGFLLGSETRMNNFPLMALPTRDAILPMIALLGLSEEIQKPISKLTESLPKRYTASDRIQDIPTNVSQQLIASLIDNYEAMIDMLLPNATQLLSIDRTDGLRVEFDTSDIVHLRASGNAPELRIYIESCAIDKAEKLLSSVINCIEEYFLSKA